jgi:hypothetical protein
MVMVGHDALGLRLAFAVALAAFLELALISNALLARAAAMAGRPAGADAAAVWVSSAVSGLFSAAHELIGPLDPASGQWGWQHDSLSLLAAGCGSPHHWSQPGSGNGYSSAGAVNPQPGPPRRSGLTVDCWPSPAPPRLCAGC